MTRNHSPIRRPARRSLGIAIAFGAVLVLSACQALDEAFSGVNPVSKKLDETAAKRGGGTDAESLAIPPGYALRPKPGKPGAGSSRVPAAGKGESGSKSGTAGADPKKIDLGTVSTGGENRAPASGAGGTILRDPRTETRGKEIVREGEPSKGEKELLKPPPKKS